MRRMIPGINLIICGACVLLIAVDALMPQLLLFNEKPAKIFALAACISTFVTASVQIAANRKQARRKKKARR
ncbi:MAG: hypothetical protein IKM02_07145 [Clostridia bacterium]|nr:hypothetical protein [Clostridia bacterium]